MARRQNGTVAIDRLRQAKQQLAAVNITIARHVIGCSRCARARQDYAERCDTGWQLAKSQARLQHDVRQLSEPAPGAPVPGALW